MVQRVGRRRQDRRHRPCVVRRNAVRARAHGDERSGQHRTARHRAGRAGAAGARQPPAVDHGARAGGGRGERADVDGLLVGRRHCGRRPRRSCSASRAWQAARATPCTCAAWTGRRRCVSARAWRYRFPLTGGGQSRSIWRQNKLLVLPTGAGEPRVAATACIKAFSWAGWFLTASACCCGLRGRQRAAGVRAGPGGRPTRPVTPEGVAVRANTLTPDGKWITARVQEQLLQFPVDGGEPQPVKGAEPEDRPLRWRDDGRVLFVRQGRLPARIYAVDTTSGQRTLLRAIGPRDTVGARQRRRHPGDARREVVRVRLHPIPVRAIPGDRPRVAGRIETPGSRLQAPGSIWRRSPGPGSVLAGAIQRTSPGVRSRGPEPGTR